MYAKVLVPLENSRADQAIVDHVRQLARLHRSRLLLVHVADGWVARYQNELDLQDSEEMRGDRAYLERRRAELSAEGFAVETLLEQGEPARRIVQVAEDRGCDLIAMATHGHGIVKDILLGSVAAGVRHRTRIPVLLVRA